MSRNRDVRRYLEWSQGDTAVEDEVRPPSKREQRRNRIERHRDDIARETQAADDWLRHNGLFLPAPVDKKQGKNYTIRPEIITHDPTPPDTVSLGPREPDSDDDLPTSAVPNWSEETVEILMHVRGHWRLYSRLSAVLPALNARVTNPRHWTDDLHLHGPEIKKYRFPPTVRHIYGRPSSGVGKIDEITVLVRGKERTHAAAGYLAEIDGTEQDPFQHECGPYCVCYWCFYFNVPTAWTHPLAEEMERWEELPRTRLTPYLKNLLWDERQPEPQAPVTKWRPLYRRYYAEKETTNYYELDADTDRPRYAKMWECYFRKGAEVTTDLDEDDFSGKIGARIAIDIIREEAGYTIVKRRPVPLWERPNHKDKVEDVMKFLRCSRATAFRHMGDGFRIPRKFRPTQAADLLKRNAKAAGKPYNNVVRAPLGSSETGPGEYCIATGPASQGCAIARP